MYDTRDITQDGEQDVDEEVCIATSLKEDTKRWEDDGEDDFANVSVGETKWSAGAMNQEPGGWAGFLALAQAQAKRTMRNRTYDAVKGMMADGLIKVVLELKFVMN